MATIKKYKRDARVTREYREGMNAFYSNLPLDANPYKKGFIRAAWYVGYYDARTNSRLNDIFQRWKIPYLGERV